MYRCRRREMALNGIYTFAKRAREWRSKGEKKKKGGKKKY